MGFLSQAVKNTTVIRFATKEKKSQKVIRGTGIHNWNEFQSQAELGFVLARPIWNLGIKGWWPK